MKRSIIIVVGLTIATAPAFGQRGKGNAGGPPVSMPQMSHSAESHAAHQAGGASDSAGKTAMKPESISAKIESNTQLASRLQPLLPAGMTMEAASAGFRNQGQFIAALHVSHNLGIPFSDLQAKMTGADPISLGKAIQTLRPAMDQTAVKTEVAKAEREAKMDQQRKQPKAGV